MSIQNEKPTNNIKNHPKDAAQITPPTIEQRIQATRIMGAIGAVLFTGFLLMIAYPIFENMRTIEVDGTVVKIIAENNIQSTRVGNQRSAVYWHQFRFTDIDGIEHIAQTVGLGRELAYPVGAVVSIGYYPDDFSKVWLPSIFAFWQYQLTLLGLGLVLISYSFWGVKHIKNEQKKQSNKQQPL
ncbi:MAG: hypothetical protein JKY14_10350 [Paraglaciecola sp.]|nr:hypothetical protein [Paraglaciecola sp.]